MVSRLSNVPRILPVETLTFEEDNIIRKREESFGKDWKQSKQLSLIIDSGRNRATTLKGLVKSKTREILRILYSRDLFSNS